MPAKPDRPCLPDAGVVPIDRAFRLHPWQWVGIPLLILIPVLAVFGVLGDHTTFARARTSPLTVAVEYPARLRYRVVRAVWVDVTNNTAAGLDMVEVALSPEYGSQFLIQSAIPPFTEPYSIELTNLAPGETRRIRIELEGERYGRQRGELLATAGGRDTVRIPLDTFVFP